MKYSVLKTIELARKSQQLQAEVEKQLQKERKKAEREKTELEKTELEKAGRGKAERGKKNKKRTYEANTEEEIRDKLVHRNVVTSIQQTIGSRLQKVRKRNELGQQKIIDQYNEESGFNIDISCLSRWETGARAVDLIFLLWFADKFNVDLNWLLTGEKQVPENAAVKELKNEIKKVYELSQKM